MGPPPEDASSTRGSAAVVPDGRNDNDGNAGGDDVDVDASRPSVPSCSSSSSSPSASSSGSSSPRGGVDDAAMAAMTAAMTAAMAAATGGKKSEPSDNDNGDDNEDDSNDDNSDTAGASDGVARLDVADDGRDAKKNEAKYDGKGGGAGGDWDDDDAGPTPPITQPPPQRPPSAPSSTIQRAQYPLSDGLARLLHLATTEEEATGPAPVSVIVHKETRRDALAQVFENALKALDRWYFSTPSAVRKVIQPHRTCLRISARRADDVASLTITDLGSGMTRADLINLLGVPGGGGDGGGGGGVKAGRGGRDGNTNSNGGNSNDNDDDGSGGSTGSESEYVDAVEEEMESDMDPSAMDREQQPAVEAEAAGATPQQTVELFCRTQDLGGFYASVCALAVGVKVGTKSQFDDYYEFELGRTPNNVKRHEQEEEEQQRRRTESGGCGDAPLPSSSASSYWTDFHIVRPFPEGTIPGTASTGMGGLADVRGTSGTSVTLYLQPAHHDLLETETVLLPLVTSILETTPYTFAVEGILPPDEAAALLHESEVEEETIRSVLAQQQQDQERDYGDNDDEEGDGEGGNEDEDGKDRATAAAASRAAYEARHTVLERAKYIPLRLSLGERKLLRLVEAAMNCCDYTTVVDRPPQATGRGGGGNNNNPAAAARDQTRRVHAQVRGVLALMRGLLTACDYRAGGKLAQGMAEYSEYLPFLRQILEIARRHKIMNPEKMRTEYGKLVYLLQDAVRLEQEGVLGGDGDVEGEERGGGSGDNKENKLSLIAPIQTVYKFLEERNGLALLRDKDIEVATEEILATPGKTRTRIDNEIRRKERAVTQLKRQYGNKSRDLTTEDIHLCLYSICDNNSFLNSNRVPIDKVIAFLKTNFSPKQNRGGDDAKSNSNNRYSLAIVHGEEGARLSHSHERQYSFALQSLTLWRDIINDMFRLWAMAERDLLNPTIAYKLQDTGQGVQRVQQSPQTYRAMQVLLQHVQQSVQQWVGSSVIHLGDHNVPNALAFIDKYTQVPRILAPIVTCLENLERMVEKDVGIHDMIEEGFGGLETLRKDILYDFFRSAFDGSGADNFYDAGSCIDGRMTSAWNWCSQLPSKPFYPIFKLTGFIGFDGEFK